MPASIASNLASSLLNISRVILESTILRPVDSGEHFDILRSARPLAKRSVHWSEGVNPGARNISGSSDELVSCRLELLLLSLVGDDNVNLHHLVVVPEHSGQVKVLVIGSGDDDLVRKPSLKGWECQLSGCLELWSTKDCRIDVVPIIPKEDGHLSSAEFLFIGCERCRSIKETVDNLEHSVVCASIVLPEVAGDRVREERTECSVEVLNFADSRSPDRRVHQLLALLTSRSIVDPRDGSREGFSLATSELAKQVVDSAASSPRQQEVAGNKTQSIFLSEGILVTDPAGSNVSGATLLSFHHDDWT